VFALPAVLNTVQTYYEEIMNLNEATKVKIEEIVEEKIVSITKIGSGVNNAVYLLEMRNKKYALKIRERGLYDFFENESKALKIMDGYIAPKIYHYDVSNPINKFMLIEYISGLPIKSISEIGIDELVALVMNVHQRTKRKKSHVKNLNSDLQAYLDDKCYSSIPELQKISFSKTHELIKTCDTVLERAGKLCYSDPEYEVLIHGDLNVTNIIKDDAGQWRLIDWELSRYTQVETEIAALIWAHSKNEKDIEKFINSDLCAGKKIIILIMTLARGLDVSTWRTKWINSLAKNDEKLPFYHSELEEDWYKIRILKEYI
jgi:aminoglycoside phosphotransferase (APT) family kinase protein